MRLVAVPMGPVVFIDDRGAGGGDLGRSVVGGQRHDAAGAGVQRDIAAVAVQRRARAGAVVEDDLARAAAGLHHEGRGPGRGGHGGGGEGDIAGLAAVADGDRAGGGGEDLRQFGVR